MANKEEGSSKDLIPPEGQDRIRMVLCRMKKISLEDHLIQDHPQTQPNFREANKFLPCMAFLESQWAIMNGI